MEEQEETESTVAEKTALGLKEDVCPDCGTKIRFIEGCYLCPACGHSKCG